MGRPVWTMCVLATCYVGQASGAKPCNGQALGAKLCIGQASGASLAMGRRPGDSCNCIAYRSSDFGFHRLNRLTARAVGTQIFFSLMHLGQTFVKQALSSKSTLPAPKEGKIIADLVRGLGIPC